MRFGEPVSAASQHRAGDVQHDEHLGVGACPERLRSLDHGLRGRRPEEHPGCRARTRARSRPGGTAARRDRECLAHAERAFSRGRARRAGTSAPRARRAPRGVRKTRLVAIWPAPSTRSPADRRRRPWHRFHPGRGSSPAAPSVSWTPLARWYASSRLYFASSFVGSSAIARCRFAMVLDRSAPRPSVSVMSRASPSTPRRPAARDRREGSGSAASTASRRACASLRRRANSGSEMETLGSSRRETRNARTASLNSTSSSVPSSFLATAERHDLVRVPERLGPRRSPGSCTSPDSTASRTRATSIASRTSATASNRHTTAPAAIAIRTASSRRLTGSSMGPRRNRSMFMAGSAPFR